MYKRNRQGVWLEAGPILFLTCTLRESSYECLKSGGHEKTLYMMLKVVQKGSVESGTYITYTFICPFYLVTLSLNVKCRKAWRQKAMQEPHNYLPLRNNLSQVPQTKIFNLSLTCSLIPHFVSRLQKHLIFFS